VYDKRRLERFHGDRQGSTALEFALLSPVLILFLFGIFLLGWAMYCFQSVRLALEQGGRALQINEALTEQDLADLVRSKLKSIGDPTILVSLSDDTTIPGVKAKNLSARYGISIPIPLYGAYDLTYSTSVTVPLTVTSGG
jgi:Flp pilus assembly protein TadG